MTTRRIHSVQKVVNDGWDEQDKTFRASVIQPTTAFGDLRTAELHPQFQGSFEYTVDNTDIIEQSTVNGGTVTQASGMGIVTTSTTTASSAMISSKRHARYKAGLGGLLRFTALFTLPVSATEQYSGLIDEMGSDTASGTVTLTGGGAGSVDGITVDSIEIMSGAESFDTDLTETARNVVTNINANTSSPNYSATSLGVIITITSDVRGTTPNGFVVTSSTSTITTTDANLSGGTSGVAFKNGYSVGYDGTTFGFHRFQNNSKTTVAQANWDDPMDGTGASGMTLDQTKLNVYAIQYQYLGAGVIRLFIESDTTGLFALVNTIDYANANTEPSTHNPNFHYHMHVANKGTTSNLIMKSSSYAYFVEGNTQYIELHQPINASGEVSLDSISSEVAILTIRNKSAYVSKTNFIDIFMEKVTGSIEASSTNNLGNIRLVLNASLGGTPSYSDINTSDSVVDIDTSGTTVTGGKELFSVPLAGKNDSFINELVVHKIIIAPGETLTVAGTSTNTATINSSLLWKELF